MYAPYQIENSYCIIKDNDVTKVFKGFDKKPLEFNKKVDAINFCDAINLSKKH